ncbi:hypothetical protein F5Y07DRAFT_375758, partial [Xylaria sp. FL0933]
MSRPMRVSSQHRALFIYLLYIWLSSNRTSETLAPISNPSLPSHEQTNMPRRIDELSCNRMPPAPANGLPRYL